MRGRFSPNVLGILYMVLAAVGYVVNDGLIRLATDEGLDVYQALCLRGVAMVVVFTAYAAATDSLPRRAQLHGPLLLRVASEVAGAVLFFAAIVQLEFANAQAILMLVPFAVTLVAALMLGEHVPASRYVLIAIGFLGVAAVVRPTPGQFSAWSLVAAASAGALVVREFATRRVDPGIGPAPIALLTAVAITAATGLISLVRGWGAINATALGLVLLACLFLVAGYVFSIEAVRVGDLSVSAPFRYTAVVGAVVVGYAFFAESPDALTIIGCALITAAGVASARLDARSAT